MIKAKGSTIKNQKCVLPAIDEGAQPERSSSSSCYLWISGCRTRWALLLKQTAHFCLGTQHFCQLKLWLNGVALLPSCAFSFMLTCHMVRTSNASWSPTVLIWRIVSSPFRAELSDAVRATRRSHQRSGGCSPARRSGRSPPPSRTIPPMGKRRRWTQVRMSSLIEMCFGNAYVENLSWEIPDL